MSVVPAFKIHLSSVFCDYNTIQTVFWIKVKSPDLVLKMQVVWICQCLECLLWQHNSQNYNKYLFFKWKWCSKCPVARGEAKLFSFRWYWMAQFKFFIDINDCKRMNSDDCENLFISSSAPNDHSEPVLSTGTSTFALWCTVTLAHLDFSQTVICPLHFRLSGQLIMAQNKLHYPGGAKWSSPVHVLTCLLYSVDVYLM